MIYYNYNRLPKINFNLCEFNVIALIKVKKPFNYF